MPVILLYFALDWTPLDKAVESAIADGQAPGAVVVIVHRGEVVYRKAFGRRSPDEKMTPDTIFDLASLTKPLATATAVMKLVDAEKLRVDDPVAKYIVGFKEGITLEHLLLHTSGLPAGSATKYFESGRESAVKHLVELSSRAVPGKFVYSDLGFITLGFIVEKVSGQTLDTFCAKEIFEPAGMKETMFRPAKTLHSRIAPTEKGLRGEVHDPRARVLGGVAGHAGLFGTADDIALYAQRLVAGKVLSAKGTRLFTEPREVPGGKRTRGWDARTAYSGNRGEHFDGFGHTGFTGTSLWIDPSREAVIIVLTSRLQNTKGNVTKLRRELATLAAKVLE